MGCLVCNGKLEGPVFESLYKCIDCGLYVNKKYSDKNTLKEFLKNFVLTASRKKEVELRRINKANIQLDNLEKYSKIGKVFDVAAAGGFFMKAAKDRGWKVDGNDISKASVDWCKLNYDIDIRYDYFEDIDLPSGEFDSVVMWNSLEHTHDPKEVIRKTYDILKSGGVVYIRVPHRTPDNVKKYFERGHSVEFNEKSLCLLLENAGFVKIFSNVLNDEEYEPIDVMYKKI
jgi:2-polyprenyl-3-methyl-5-hydroxy-6-metoxy-1,4-benzoquinol methylase